MKEVIFDTLCVVALWVFVVGVGVGLWLIGAI